MQHFEKRRRISRHNSLSSQKHFRCLVLIFFLAFQGHHEVHNSEKTLYFFQSNLVELSRFVTSLTDLSSELTKDLIDFKICMLLSK